MDNKYIREKPGRKRKELSQDIKEEIAREYLYNNGCKHQLCKAYGINYTQLICIVGEWQVKNLEDTIAQLRAENTKLVQERDALQKEVLRLNIMNNKEGVE